ncbi:Serine/threonine-protein phosphatase with EF-hands 2 [Collichthys lucidus]|uniref:Serine/threonine-protein phosphatase with EF-hands n=1 Tax=Collichthys lucidus TaxID=240159 RepID=A0A4U5UTD6_COLLU|nr:Serine/threonine-protein phosphatase with EF-hands 2 [Collichthys lucidus]
MGCGVTKSDQFHKQSRKALRAAVLIQRWYRQYVARTETRRRYTWHIFQSIEYSGEQAQIKLYNFLGYLMDNFTPSSNERNLISHIFRENEVCRDTEWERYFCYKNIEVPEIYSGPHLTFPLTVEQAVGLVEAFRNKKNGMPCLEKPYVFNGDFVDRGKDSIEILIILFSFLLVYPSDVYLNRGNHEDHIVNLRYGFTKEVLTKYKMHGKRILKLLQKIFSWLPLATVIDQKVLVLHGGISDVTDLSILSRLDRHNYVSALRPPKKRHKSSAGMSIDSEMDEDILAANKLSQRRISLAYPKPFGERASFQNRSLQDFSDRIKGNAVDELESRMRKQSIYNSGIVSSEKNITASASSDSINSDNSNDEWKQVLDLLWSDPMPQDGCTPNEVRGGGCYWGPDITEDFLNRHNLQLIIRSHECKQDGYEFCHNRKVLTLFSASNYYDVGSNRGAYVKLGPDLVPYLIQYQASSMTRELTVRQSVGRTERSALKVLREQLFAHKSDLVCAFKKFDSENTGLVSVTDWATAVESVMFLGLPWRMLRCQLVTSKIIDGMIDYNEWFSELNIKGSNTDHIDQSLLETLYRHRSTLETIFRIVDTDNSGFITIEDFRQTWKLLSVYLKMEITDEAISDLAVTIDSNQDGSIDIDEFMEAFRLTDKKSRLERGRSMFMGTASDLTKLEGDPNI